MAKVDKSKRSGRIKAAGQSRSELKRSDRGGRNDGAREGRNTEDDASPSLPSKERIAEVLR